MEERTEATRPPLDAKPVKVTSLAMIIYLFGFMVFLPLSRISAGDAARLDVNVKRFGLFDQTLGPEGSQNGVFVLPKLAAVLTSDRGDLFG